MVVVVVGGATLSVLFFSQPLPQEVAFVPEHPASLLGLWIRRWADPDCADLPDPGGPQQAPRSFPLPHSSRHKELSQARLSRRCLSVLWGQHIHKLLRKKKEKIIYHAFISWWF